MAAILLLEGTGVSNGLAPKAVQTKPKNQGVVKRVSWAPEYNLCQVRLFLAEDAPFQSGLADQDHLQAKQSRLWHGYGSGSEGNQLLGFGDNYTKQNIQEDSIVPETTWCCPPRFVMNLSWQVVAGDESLEVKVQCEREVRNLEAIYPRPSSIPPSPIEPLELQEDYCDSDTPMIPLIPVEDDETGDLNEVPSSQDFGELGIGSYEPFRIMQNMIEIQPNSTGISSQGGNSVSVVTPSVDQQRQSSLSISKPATEPDITAAAAFVAIAKSNEKGNMFDHDMVLKILSNPQIIETLTSQLKRNNNIQMDLMPNLQAIDSKHDAPNTPCNVGPDQSVLTMSILQGACQVASSGIIGNNRSSLVTCEMACGNFQGASHLCNKEVKSFGAPVAVAQTSISMASSSPLPPMAGLANSHLLSTTATVSDSTTMGMDVVRSNSPSWKEMARMPPSMIKEFEQLPFDICFDWVGLDGCLYFTAYGYSTANDTVLRVGIYNINENSWSWLPTCSMPPGPAILVSRLSAPGFTAFIAPQLSGPGITYLKDAAV